GGDLEGSGDRSGDSAALGIGERRGRSRFPRDARRRQGRAGRLRRNPAAVRARYRCAARQARSAPETDGALLRGLSDDPHRVGGLVATLPISAGPVYFFLALDHDAQFIAASALASLTANAVTGQFALVYILVAQIRAPATSLAVVVGFWLLAIFLVRSFEWT